MNPKSSAVLTVIRTLERVLPYARKRGSLNFSKGTVQCVAATCGTPHCHGGWFAVGLSGVRKPNIVKRLFTGERKERSASFMEGAEAIAEILGFYALRCLLTWADDNPGIWGNVHGASMFDGNGAVAFTSAKRPFGALTLQHIVDHWTEVYERLVVLEAEEVRLASLRESVEISEPPITAEALMLEMERAPEAV